MTHYDVLGLSPALLREQADPSPLVRRAYRRALLRNHPDKKPLANGAGPDLKTGGTGPRTGQPATTTTTITATSTSTPSIDQISEALRVLSSPSLRAKYDQSLQLARRDLPGPEAGQSQNEDEASPFRTGVENVDLDDLAWDPGAGVWTRSCRCGNDRGFVVAEADLEEADTAGNGGGLGELLVGCLDCSLWLRVHFAVLEEEEEEEEDDNDDDDDYEQKNEGGKGEHAAAAAASSRDVANEERRL